MAAVAGLPAQKLISDAQNSAVVIVKSDASEWDNVAKWAFVQWIHTICLKSSCDQYDVHYNSV